LEIGTGCGYQTAVLAEIVKTVYSVEIIPGLAQQAKTNLAQNGYAQVALKIGDGFEGWPQHAPYDAILVTAAPAAIPEGLAQQLKVGGKMVVRLEIFIRNYIW